MDKLNVNMIDASQAASDVTSHILGIAPDGSLRRVEVTPSLSDTYSRETIDSKDAANKAYTDQQISELIGGATPEQLSTLKELADALSQSGDAIVAINAELSTKYGPSNKPTPADIGAANAVHEHNYFKSQDARFYKPKDALPASGGLIFVDKDQIGLPNLKGKFGDLLVLNSYSDTSGGGINGILTCKDSNTMYHLRGSQDADFWETASKVYTEAEKPTPSEIGALPEKSDSAYLFLNNANQAQRVNTGGLLTSDAYSDESRVPHLGIYSKGSVSVGGQVQVYGNSGEFSIVKHQTSFGGEGWLTAIDDQNPTHNAIGVSQEWGAQTYFNGNRYRLYGEHFKPTYADVGAVPIAGGTMVGNLHANSGGGFYPNANHASQLGNSDWRFNEGWINHITASSINVENNLSSMAIGVSNTASDTGLGLSLYGGVYNEAPAYGMFFAGTPKYGTHGYVTGDWATYFTMAGATNRGWVFKQFESNNNVASISATGNITGSGQVRGTTTGLEFNYAGLETLATGTDPSISFHKAESYAATLSLTGPDTWAFKVQSGSVAGTNVHAENYHCTNVYSGNIHSSTLVSGGRVYAGWDSGVAGSISCNAWFRSAGDTGWYNSTYGGGIYMKDTTWIRTYDGKKFFVENGDHDAIHTIGGVSAVGDLSTQRNVGCSGDVYARSFYGNANIGGTGQAVNCPAGIYSQGTNWLYGEIITAGNRINAGTGDVICGSIQASGRVTTSAGFSGDGSGLTNIPRSAINEGWVVLYNNATKASSVTFTADIINHLNNGGWCEINLVMRSDGDLQKTISTRIAGGGVWTSSKYKEDLTWQGRANVYLHNSHTGWGGSANALVCQYAWITYLSYRLI